MTIKLLLAGAAAAAIALPAIAQVPTASPSTTGQFGPAIATPPANPDPMVPPADDAATTQAETGVAANTSTAESDLKAGATVTDATGAEIGTISKITKGQAGVGSQVTLMADGKTVTVPASSLVVSGGALVSSASKADVWAAPK